MESALLIPASRGGNGLNMRPLRRAARMDGVIPEHARGGQVTPAELGEVVSFIAAGVGIALHIGDTLLLKSYGVVYRAVDNRE